MYLRKKTIAIIVLTSLVYPLQLLGQDSNDDGFTRYTEDSLSIAIDDFTGSFSVSVDTSRLRTQIENNGALPKLLVIPMYTDNFEHSLKSDAWMLMYFYSGEGKYFKTDEGITSVPFLADEERLSLEGELETKYEKGKKEVFQLFVIGTSEKSVWDKLSKAQELKFRVAGNVTTVTPETLNQMVKISNKVSEIKNELGYKVGDNESYSPYEISWDSGIDRAPVVQPLPENSTNAEGVITVRFEARPDGTVGRIIPLRKMNPELEREVISTLRSWRFSSLPGGVPQQSSWGTITFRFIIQ